MKILRIKLENFQGVKEFEMAPDGENCSVYGDNGTGKSTIYNAFTWLMYGKPSTGEKNYTPKTTGSHNLHHAVELAVELDDGSVLTLKKDYHEVYKTVKGSAQEVFAGHTTDYYTDGIPVNETQFKKTLALIYRDEETAKMLTMYNYFLETTKVADRRKVLLQVCGNVKFEEVIAETPELAALPDMLRKPGNTASMYTVDEYRAVAAKEKGKIDRELRDIPQRIDEAEKAKPDLGGMNEKSIRQRIAELRSEAADLEAQRAASSTVADAQIRKQIAELESRRASGQAAHTQAEAEKNRGAYERISNLRYAKSDCEMSIMHLEQDVRAHQNEITVLEKRRERLLAEYQAEDEKEWSGNEVCPTCKRPLPPEEVAAAREAFNVAKANRLEEINRRGMKECSSSMIEAEKAEIAKLQEQISIQRQKQADTEQMLAEANRAVLEETPYSTTQEYMDFTRQITELQAQLKDMQSTVNTARMQLSKKIQEVNVEIENESRKLAAFSFAEQQEKRKAELEAKEKELAARYEHVQHGIYLCELYMRAQAKMLDEKINSRFKTLRFRLFIEQQNGGIADDCEALVPCPAGLVPFKSANNAARINAGLELIDTLAEYYGLQMPVFVDNAESVTAIQHTAAQVLRLVVSEPDKALRFEKGDA
ncbi:MAG: AAA family ATPase [Lachnospiraceae bacterium]|nr:AAA family ATPase [Lachnospiraceae bacterium]